MMAMLLNLGMKLAGAGIGLISEKGKAKTEEIGQRIENMGRSWTDEYIILVLSLPFIVGWFSEAATRAYFMNLSIIPDWYSGLFMGDVAAVFGLGKVSR